MSFSPPHLHCGRRLPRPVGALCALLLGLGMLAAAAPAARGDVRLHALFTDNMVLQRGLPVTVWGTAETGENIVVKFQGQTVKATAKDGRNFYEVEARFESRPAGLRPGLQGVAKIDAGEQSLAWIWTHRLVNWARLFIWTYLP